MGLRNLGTLDLLFFVVGVAFLGLFAYLFLRSVLHLRLWLIAVLALIFSGLLLHFATLSVLASAMFLVF